MFLSQRPNNDPAPFHKKGTGIRSDTNVHSYGRWEFDPRPEFTQTRDPLPVKNLLTPDRYPDMDNALHFAGRDASLVAWAPRHEEFDTPVNPYLTIFREQMFEKLQEGSYAMQSLAAVWLEDGMEETDIEFLGFTIDQHSHARRVLSKLVAVYGG